MVLCWSQQPKDRPSASQIVSIASAPEFTHLSDVTSLKHDASVVASASAALTHITGALRKNCLAQTLTEFF
jgi:ADP-heptose:LPS heptosyltransferase